MTPAAPPSADTVWLRIGYTLDTTATSSPGLVSAMAMAARSPAPPPPTIRTSCAARRTLSLTPPLLVRQHLSVVVDDHAVAATVVELFPGAAAPAGVAEVLGHQTLVVLGQVPLAAVSVSARCECWFKSGSGCAHGSPPSGAGTATWDVQDERAPHRPDWEGLPAWSRSWSPAG